MRSDRLGLALSTASGEATAAFEDSVAAYVGYRTDAQPHLARALAADPGFALAHCFGGYLAMLPFKAANLPPAAEAARRAGATMGEATARERAHLAALDAWIAGDLDRSLAIWDGISADHPADLVAFRLAHFNNFWLGRRKAMREAAERALPAWDRAMPGYATILSCLSFASEECGDYEAAERAGGAALEADPGDLWGIHALAHVKEMQGRSADGVAFLDRHERFFAGGNNFVHHLWWHRAMFELERRDVAAVLELYDRRFRNLTSPLTESAPDLYIDVQNAASMLFRLERQGVDVGDRWVEIADKAARRIGDCLSAFTLPHWMMALAATGRDRAAQQMLAAMREAGQGAGTVARLVSAVALPVSEAVLAHRRGEPLRALALMRPVLGEMQRLGGSHAQQDVLEQLFLDAALKAGCSDDVRLALARARSRYPTPPAQRVGYADAARRFPS